MKKKIYKHFAFAAIVSILAVNSISFLPFKNANNNALANEYMGKCDFDNYGVCCLAHGSHCYCLVDPQ